jgi:hypothetical protein
MVTHAWLLLPPVGRIGQELLWNVLALRKPVDFTTPVQIGLLPLKSAGWQLYEYVVLSAALYH